MFFTPKGGDFSECYTTREASDTLSRLRPQCATQIFHKGVLKIGHSSSLKSINNEISLLKNHQLEASSSQTLWSKDISVKFEFPAVFLLSLKSLSLVYRAIGVKTKIFMITSDIFFIQKIISPKPKKLSTTNKY